MDVLICNGIQLDLSGDTPFPLDLSIMDLLEPQKRQRNKSKQIVFSGTSNNCAFFYSVFAIHVTGNNVTFDATVKATCQYYKNDVLIMPDGILRLLNVSIMGDNITFTTEIYGESVDLFLLLSEIRVADLDWSAYDHLLTRANIIASWSTPSGTGYRYPLIERGNNRAGTTIWNTKDLIPYVHCSEIIYKMFEYLGIEITSTFLESTRAKNMLWGYGGGDFIQTAISPADIELRRLEVDEGVLTYSQTFSGLSQNIFDTSGYFPSAIGVQTQFTFPNQNLTSPQFTSNEVKDDLLQYDNGRITIARSGNYQITMSGIIEIELTGGNTFESYQSFAIRLIKNNNVTLFYPFNQSSFLTQLTPTSWEFNFNISNSFLFQSGDEITTRFELGIARYSRTLDEVFVPLNISLTTVSDILIDMTCIDTSVTDGGTVSISRFIPDMKCSDFLMSFMKQFYITTTDPDLNGVVKFEPLIDFYQGTNVFDDISEDVDIDKAIEIKPSANSFAKNHIYAYKDNKDTDNVVYFENFGHKYGDYTFTQGSFYSKGDNKIEVAWSNIVPYEISPGILVPRFVIIDNNGGVKGNKGNSRIMMWNGLKNGSWTFRNTDDPTLQQVLTTYPCVHHFDNWENPTFDLNFQLVQRVYYNATVVTTINTFSEYNSTFLNEITSPLGRIVNLSVKWNERDVKNRDFSKLIMRDGALFRLNNIKDFDSDKATSCRIELIKVLEARKRSTKPLVNNDIPLQDGLAGLASGGFGIDTTDDDAPPIDGGGVDTVLVNSKKLKG